MPGYLLFRYYSREAHGPWPPPPDDPALADDFFEAVQRAITQAIPAATLKGVWEGPAVDRATGKPVPPPRAEIRNTGWTFPPDARRKRRRQTFTLTIYGRNKDEVRDISGLIEGVLHGHVVFFRGGRVYGTIQVDKSTGRKDEPGTTAGGVNVWSQEDAYWADLV